MKSRNPACHEAAQWSGATSETQQAVQEGAAGPAGTWRCSSIRTSLLLIRAMGLP